MGPAAVDGQSDSARIRELEDRVVVLEQMLGKSFLTRPPAPSDFVPSNELGASGRYPYIISDYQIRLGLAAGFTGQQAQLSGFATRMAAAERSIDSLRNVTAGTTGPIIAPFSNGNNLYIPTGKLIIGTGCPSDAQAQIQICGSGDANIMAVSNQNGQQYQNASAHVGMWSLSSDGGLRILQNAYQSVNCVTATDPTNGVQYQNCMKKFVDPTREYSAHGPDARGRFSFLMQEPSRAYDYTQNLVLNYYYDQKVLSFESMQAGWIFKFATSSTPRGLEAFYQLPR